MIKVIPEPRGQKLTTGGGIKVVDQDGNEIEGVSRATINFELESIVTAEITVAATCEEVWAQPFMSEDSFLKAAKRYGYSVAKDA